MPSQKMRITKYSTQWTLYYVVENIGFMSSLSKYLVTYLLESLTTSQSHKVYT